MAWERTWLYRVRDCYLVSWKLNDEEIRLSDMPGNAFDTPEERNRVAAVLEKYNEDLTLTPEEDAVFAQLARERTVRHPCAHTSQFPCAAPSASGLRRESSSSPSPATSFLSGTCIRKTPWTSASPSSFSP